MNGKRKTSYPLAVFLNTLSTAFLTACIVAMAYIMFRWGGTPNVEIASGVILAIGVLQFVVFKAPLKAMYQQAVYDNEYDEFGNSKKKKFSNLTRAEREEVDLQKTTQMEQIIPSSVMDKIIKKGSTAPQKDLDSLIGLQTVKTKVTEMVARMEFEKSTVRGRLRNASSEYGMNGRHFVFYGSAGTGKTTVARIVTGFLFKYGYIRKNKCVEINGTFLKAGEMSVAKTRMIIQQSYGGVLFIDEAYSIITDNTGYGDAIIATLIKEMEDNRDKFTVILAGYKNDIKRLLDSNEGFKSRIKEYLEFPDYNVEEMKQIFVSMAHSEGFAVSGEALSNFETRCSKELKLLSFGNGRTVRNILDETIDRHALNFQQGLCERVEGEIKISNKDNKFMICGCDVNTSVNKSAL